MISEKLKKLARSLGQEAEENHFSLSEYYEDFCLFLGVENWKDVGGEVKIEIIKEFKVGKKENSEARKSFR